MTTHVALTARALGTKGILVDGKDGDLERTIRSVVRRFGGDFAVETGVAWRSVLASWPGTIVHLTMYGVPLEEVIPRLPDPDRLLVVVGAQKVPGEVYARAHWNVAVGHQPHSEVAALAIFLDRLRGRLPLPTPGGGQVRIVPSPRGKVLLRPGGVPRPPEARALLQAHGARDDLVKHCEAVARWATTLAAAAGGEVGLVTSGALLHDIGRTRVQGWGHGPEGARLLRGAGVAGSVAAIAASHMGAGLTAAEAEARGLPPQPLLPETLEARIVCVADRMTRGSEAITVDDALGRIRAMGLPVKRFLGYVQELEKAIGRPLDDLRVA